MFSPAWWDLLRLMIAECKTRGMQLSFQDYCLLNPMLAEIGQTTPGMLGGRLVETSARLNGGEVAQLQLAAGVEPVGAWAYRTVGAVAIAESVVELSAQLADGHLGWTAPDGSWLVCLVGREPHAFDPLHPESGRLALERFYGPFERECPGELGKTLAISFQDELDFGRMPFWSPRLRVCLGNKSAN